MRFTPATRWKITPLCESGDGTTVTHFGIWDNAGCRYWPHGARRWTPGYSMFTDPGVNLFTDRADAQGVAAELKSR